MSAVDRQYSLYHTAWEVKRSHHGTILMYTMAAPVILVVSYGTTRLLRNSPAHSHSTQTNQINYDTSHGFLMGMVLYHPPVNDVLPPASPSLNLGWYNCQSHGTTITCFSALNSPSSATVRWSHLLSQFYKQTKEGLFWKSISP